MLVQPTITGNSYAALVAATVFSIMLSVGAHISGLDELRQTFRGQNLRAIALTLAAVLFGLQPVTVLLCRAFRLDSSTSLALLLLASCPGGSAASVFAKLARGNVLVNGTMTLSSTVLSLVTLPLSMICYKPLITQTAVAVNFPMLVLSMGMLVVALGAGAACCRHCPRATPYIRQLSGPPAFVLIFSVVVLGGIPEFPAATWGAAFALAVSGAACAFLLALLARAEWSCVKSLTLELLVRDAALALTIATSAFSGHASDIARYTVEIYGLTAYGVSTLLVLAFRCYDMRAAARGASVKDDGLEPAAADDTLTSSTLATQQLLANVGGAVVGERETINAARSDHPSGADVASDASQGSQDV